MAQIEIQKHENFEYALNKFNRMVASEQILKMYRGRQFYKSKSEKRRLKKMRAAQRARKHDL